MARARFRSPRHDLAASLEVARIVREAGGSLAADIVAPALGYRSTNSGAYLARVASARLFGLVGGRGARLELTERGTAILDGAEPAASAARRQAVLAVPLYAEVLGWLEGDGAGADLAVAALDPVLVERFGEPPDRAAGSAERLVTSAHLGGLLDGGARAKFQLITGNQKFTSVENSPIPGVAGVQSILGLGVAGSREGDMDDAELFLEEATESKTGRRSTWRRLGVVAAAAAVAAAVAVPVALVATGSTSPSRDAAPHGARGHHQVALVKGGPAQQQVLRALSATTDSGNFDVTYTLTGNPPATASSASSAGCPSVTGINPGGPNIPATTSTTGGSSSATAGSVVPVTSDISSPPARHLTCQPSNVEVYSSVTGSGIIDVDPMAMVVSASITTDRTQVGQPTQTSGLGVSVREDGTNLYEGGLDDNGVAPQADDTGGTLGTSALDSFVSLVLSTLGSRTGAVAVFGLASPSGYLDLYQQGITAAGQDGTGTVDGVPVTQYLVDMDPKNILSTPGLTSEQQDAINQALGVLNTEDFTTETELVSVDSAGFIREVRATVNFADGGNVVLDSTFTDFGCAGTVLMPGQSGPSSPPANCTSPDNPSAAGTTTTTASGDQTGSTTTTSRGAPPSASGRSGTTTSSEPPATTTTTTAGAPVTDSQGGTTSST